MAELIDQPMADTTEADAHLPLSEDEQRVLALYDRLKELQLEISLIKAQKRYQEGLACPLFFFESRKKVQGLRADPHLH